MTRLPQVTHKDLIRFLKAHGFEEVRQKGSHLVLENRSNKINITVPVHSGSDLPRGLLFRILRDAGLNREDFLSWKS